MNIAIFTNNYLPNPYGVSGSIESFRKQFESRGHTVFIFAPSYKNYKDTNHNIFRYPSIDISYKISSKEIKKILRETDGEVTSINLWRGRSPNQEAQGVSADNDLWEINIRRIKK